MHDLEWTLIVAIAWFIQLQCSELCSSIDSIDFRVLKLSKMFVKDHKLQIPDKV